MSINIVNKQMVIKPLLVLSLVVACYAGKAMASNSSPAVTPPGDWFVGAGVGLVMPNLHHTTNFASSGIPGFPQDQYVSTKVKNTMQYSALVGYQWSRSSVWFPAFSVGLQYLYSRPHVNGTIYQFSLPQALNFGYGYKVSQQLIMLNFKTDVYRWGDLMPFVTAGIGMAIHQVSGYSNWAIPGQTNQNKADGFTSQSTHQLAESIGVGLDYMVGDNVELSLGYAYTYTGAVRTGLGTGTLSSDRLMNKLSSNTAYLQASYYF